MWFDSIDQSDRWAPAIQHLCQTDPVLRQVIAVTGPCTLKPRRDYFVVLCKSIFSQQISTTVAAVLFGRFRNLFPLRRPTPQRVIDLVTTGRPDRLASCGLSRQKQAYILDLARHFADGKIPTARLQSYDDEQIIESLTQIKGIGRWTAEMFLIFVLNRTDLLPVDDLGLAKGVQLAYRLPKMPTRAELAQRAEPWRPYRSIATWYFWKQPKVLPTPAAAEIEVKRDGSTRQRGKLTAAAAQPKTRSSGRHSARQTRR
jgi:DNA-3-methyladenine glycosylase II